MTTSQRLKQSIISMIEKNKPDEIITVVDGKARKMIELPCIAVDVLSVTAHSEALQHVETVSIAATLRLHAGDESDGEVDSWIDQIETLLMDVSLMRSRASGVMVYSWTYNGSSMDWDENMIEVTFDMECMASRFDVQEQSPSL